MYKIPFERVNWVTSSFLFGTAFIALTGFPLFLWKIGFESWIDASFQFVMFMFYVSATMMSITVGYHRLFSHLSFKAKLPVRLFALIFGACAFENSALSWASDHRRHHKFVDHDGDPYDISKGFMWAHIGWLLFKLEPEPPMDNVADLRKDKLVMWQDRWVHLIALVVGLILPTVLSFAWNAAFGLNPWHGALAGLLIPGVLRIVVAQHGTFFINSLCHTIGKQPYSTKHSSRDSAVMAFLTFGEGYHNYHHEFQHDYRNGVKPWQWDPSKWAIWTFSKLGLATDLRKVPEGKILLAEMAEARLKAAKGLKILSEDGAAARAYEKAQVLMEKLTANYHELEKCLAERVQLSQDSLNRFEAETRQLAKAIHQTIQRRHKLS